MEIKKIMIGVVCAMILFSAVLTGEEEEQQELTRDAWKVVMNEATAKRDQLRGNVGGLDKAIAQLRMRDAQIAEEIQKGNEELTTLLAEPRRKEFETRWAGIETKLNELEQYSGQTLPHHEGGIGKVGASIAEARGRKLAKLQKYKERITVHQKRLEQMQSLIAQRKTDPKEIVVGTWSEERACLWNIAKKQEVYGTPALWVKLWEGNKSEISNPDVLRPGQKLRVPMKAPLTTEEMAALCDYHNERGMYDEGAFAHAEKKKIKTIVRR